MDENRQIKERKQFHRNLLKDIFDVDYHPSIHPIPEGKSGEYMVVDKIDHEGQFIYQKLYRGDTEVTSNHPNALERHKYFLAAAKGRVLVSGLGLGETLFRLIQKRSVSSVRVLESSPDVIALVRPAIEADPVASKKVDIVEANVFAYSPSAEEHYTCIYHSIWSSPQEQEKGHLSLLTERFEGICDWHGIVYHTKPPRGGPGRGGGRKRGRPVGPVKAITEQRTVRKGIRLTPPEYQVVQKAAELSGMTESAIMQQGIVREARKVLQEHAILTHPDLKEH